MMRPLAPLCPSCGGPLVPEPSLGLGHCGRCDQVVSVPAPPAPYGGARGRVLSRVYHLDVVPDPPHLLDAQRTLRVPPPPPGLRQRESGDTIELELPWMGNTDTGLLMFVGCFAVLPLMSLFSLVERATPTPDLASVVRGFLGTLAIGGSAWAYLAHIARNRTLLRITRDAVQIEHGPWPNLQSSRTLPLGSMQGLQVESWTSPDVRMRSVLFTLRTRERTLLEHWTNVELLHHVKTCIEVQRARRGLIAWEHGVGSADPQRSPAAPDP